MDPLNVVSSAHPAYLESLYRDFKKDPDSIQQEWRSFFEGFDFAVSSANGVSAESISPNEFKVYALIDAYRRKGHLIAHTNPIRERKDRHANLQLDFFDLSEDDLNTTFVAAEVLGLGKATLQEVLDKLKNVYCRNLGFEYMYLTSNEEKQWFKKYVESTADAISYDTEEKKRFLRHLNGAVIFEEFLSTKYIGQKRFSLEGGESTIAALKDIIDESSKEGVQEVVIGMAHRGRLNVLANVLGKTYAQIFNEFEGTADPDLTMGDGDVKYHLGYSSEITTNHGKTVHVKLSPNPSHLEAVTPVIHGFARAKTDILYASDTRQILPIAIHGDAALAGQGVVYEVLQMSKLKGYQVGGTIHFVINNQIGFTTDFDDARSSHYSTSVAATVKAPVIHVNGDDVEAVIYAVRMATAYRQKFGKDIFVDMVCYRKHGHNEGDDPKYTQPHLYDLINKHPNAREIYLEKLLQQDAVDKQLAKEMQKEFKEEMNKALQLVKEKPLPYHYQDPELWWKQLRKSRPEDFINSPETGVEKSVLEALIKGIIKVPKGFEALRKVKKMLDKRREYYEETGMLDWASGELLAYASILKDGNDVRISGQDSVRGTFSHRHAKLFNEEGEEYNRLDNLFDGQKSRFRIYNSLLSEYAVLGFEYGYAMASPQSLVIWEAQFGDFANGAQVIIDQFISSAESKWQRMNGLVMLLPHGYEGQGPEHSSARLERFLQLCAEFNMVVANITTPANLYHALRRQLAWPFRKPLVIMSPKSLLRHPKCVSHIDDFTKGGFKELIVDRWDEGQPKKVKKLVFCSGKIYYDLLERQENENRKDIVVVRLEQLYPLPYEQIDNIMDEFPNATKYWVQDEPANMGAWVYILSCYRKVDWQLISRKSSASPATGYHKIHEQQQQYIIDQVFA